MADRTALARLGRLVAADVAAGQPGANSQAVSHFLGTLPDAVLDILDMLLAEVRKKRRSERLVTAYAFMLGQALESVRYGVERGHADAAGLVDAVRRRLLAAGDDGQLEPALLLMVLREFATAKLDPGPELRELMERSMDRMAQELPRGDAGRAVPPPGSEGAFEAHVEDIAREAGGDPFVLHAELTEIAAAFPDDHRATMGFMMLRSREAAAREAALGWLLDPATSVRTAVAAGVEQVAAGVVSGTMLRRLVALRNWLPEPDRAPVDRAIQACRRKGVEIAPSPQPVVREVLASGIDGAGAQSVFVLSREGRRNAVACFLLKQGVGVRDAWARHGLTQAELGEFLGQVNEIDLFPTGLDYVRVAAAHALGVNLASGVMPPFALLDAAEVAGLHGLQPEVLPLDAVLGRLAAEADPALSRPEGIAEALAESRALADEFAVLDSWFEADDEVERLLGGKGLSRAKRVALVRDELLPRRTAKWAERLARTALALRHGEEDEPWEAFYVSAREVAAGRPVGEIPLMMHVAELTVDAHSANRPEPRSLPRSGRR